MTRVHAQARAGAHRCSSAQVIRRHSSSGARAAGRPAARARRCRSRGRGERRRGSSCADVEPAAPRRRRRCAHRDGATGSSCTNAPMWGSSARTTRSSSAAGRAGRGGGPARSSRRTSRRVVLLHPPQIGRQRVEEQPPAERLEPRREVPYVSSARDRLRSRRAHGTAIQPGGEPHDRHAGLGVPGHDRPLHGRGAAPARQQRRVDVEDVVSLSSGSLISAPNAHTVKRVRAGRAIRPRASSG